LAGILPGKTLRFETYQHGRLVGCVLDSQCDYEPTMILVNDYMICTTYVLYPQATTFVDSVVRTLVLCGRKSAGRHADWAIDWATKFNLSTTLTLSIFFAQLTVAQLACR